MSTTWKARPTTYQGIEMRSRLEATFAATLDALGIPWEYEPRVYAAPGRRQYLPDFEVPATENTKRFFIEVRPTVEGAHAAMGQMPVIFESDPDAVLIVTVPDGPSWSTRSLKERGPDGVFRYGWRVIEIPWGYRE